MYRKERGQSPAVDAGRAVGVEEFVTGFAILETLPDFRIGVE